MDEEQSLKDVVADYRLFAKCNDEEISVHSKWHDNDTMLHVACSMGHLEEARILIETGADINASGANGATPLHVAIKYGLSLELVRHLVAKGASLEAVDANNDRPIHVASQWSRFEIIELLLDAGADVNARGSLGMTALHLAASNGTVTAVELLVRKGAVIQDNDAGESPLDLAERKRDTYRRICDELRKIAG